MREDYKAAKRLAEAAVLGDKVKTAANYWFGMATGVVDILTKNLPYQTEKLLRFFRKGIIDGSISPFSGEIRKQGGALVQEDLTLGGGNRNVFVKMTPDRIISMDWLNEKIEGDPLF